MLPGLEMATSAMGSTGEDYSDSFELDEEIESISLGSSFDSSTVSAQVISRQVEHSKAEKEKKSQQAGVISSAPILKNVQIRPATGGLNGKTATFKAAAQQVQTMQSVARHFTDSMEVRKAVFSEWISRKQAKMSSEQSEIVKGKMEKEEIKRRKDEELAERSVKAVDKWNAAKTAELLKKQKQKKEEVRAQQLKAKEKEERQLSSELASEKWREEKTKLLVSQHREKKTKAQEEEYNIKDDATEKERSINIEQAFKAWSEKKDRIIKDQRRKRKKEKEELELKKLEEAYIKQEEAQRVVQAWKWKKDEKIKETGSLYTYTEKDKSRKDEKIKKTGEKEKMHPQAWCPARSMKYSYPDAPKKNEKIKKTGSGSEKEKMHTQAWCRAKIATSRGERSSSSVHSVSTSTASVQSEGSYTSLSSTGSSRATSPKPSAGNYKGKPKTIQVCCQTLEYWCTCGD